MEKRLERGKPHKGFRFSQKDVEQLLENEFEIHEKNRYRLILLGSCGVGKSAIIKRFLYGNFSENYMPTIEDFYKKIYRIKSDTYLLEIIDSSGCCPFPAMQRTLLQTGDVFLLVFSITNAASFHEIKILREQILEAKATQRKSKLLKYPPIIPMVIVGNKSDKESKRSVAEQEVRCFTRSQKSALPYVEVSAKNNVFVEEAFMELFAAASMPIEMIPSKHRRLSPSFNRAMLPYDDANSSVRSNTSSFPRRVGTIKSKYSNIGVINPVARRPSIGSELRKAQKIPHHEGKRIKRRSRSTRGNSNRLGGTFPIKEEKEDDGEKRCNLM